ncbi:MAG TPA: YceD family protein [Methylovirgula sp.]|nr:YceD family protein [Methylovirgula sp.]
MPESNPQPTGKIFSHLVYIEDVPEQGLDLSISADPAARQALAEADGLAGIESLEADFHVARQGLETFNVSGTLRAKVTQVCVLSLEPFDSEIVEEIDVDFAPPSEAARAAESAGTIVGVPGAPERDPPDPLVDGTIDVGALAAEFLALGLDPYPKKPGVEFAPMTDPEEKDGPFDVLRKLTDRG